MLRRSPSRYRHLSIFAKLLIIIFATTAPMLGLVFYGLLSSSRLIYHQTAEAFTETLTQTGIRIQEMKSNAEAVSLYLSIDAALNSDLAPASSRIEEYERHRRISNTIASIDRTYPAITSVHVVNAETGMLYSSYRSAVARLPDFADHDAYRTAFTDRGAGVWTLSDLAESPALEELFRQQVVGFTRVLNMEQKPMYGLNNVGIVNISPLVFQSIMADAGERFQEMVLVVADEFAISRESGVVNPNATVRGALERASGPAGFFRSGAEGQNLVYFHRTLAPGWTLVAMTPLRQILAGTYPIRVISVLSGLLIVGFGVITAHALQLHLNRPLHELIAHMQRVHDGDLEAFIDDSREDEFGTSFSMFNDMTRQLRELADRVFKEGERTREAELMLLQSQINPHFLYNSLDTIYWMAERARATEIAQMAMWLGRFYRLNLSKGQDTITMDQMVGQITSYLNIQQVRFRGRFDYSIRVADGLGDHGIPNLLVQPLVENAVYHGVEQALGHGRILLAVRKRAGKLQIVVHDNGVGISTERLGAIRRELYEFEESSCSYGLKNVHERVRLKYGLRFGLHVASRPGRGTLVRLDIPEVKADADA